MTREKWLKVLKGALIAGAGPAVLYALQAIDAMDFGTADMAVAALISVLVNLVRQALRPS